MTYPSELTQTYEIYEQIGAGGGGTVYRAMHKRLQKTVVIKKLKGTAASIQDCRTEVDILKNLRHSYLPQVIDFIDSSEGIFTVMDFIPGKSLQKLLEEKHRFTEQEVLKYTRQLCEALNYLHSQNPPIVHGDIKPDNIMITPEGNVCLIDFNISGVLEGKGAITYGYTPGYSAPEQAEAFEKLKKQMQGEMAQPKNGKNAERQTKKSAGQKEASDKTVLLTETADDADKTVLLAENADDADKTVLLAENADDADKTVLLAENADDADKTVLLAENADDADKTILLAENAEDSDKTVLLTTENGEKVQFHSHVAQPGANALPQVSQKPSGIPIDKRSDVYSLGATVYALLTGKIRNPKEKKLVLPETSSGFSVVLAKALAYSPEKRYQDAGKMLQAVLSVHKKDKRYKRLLYRQELTFVLLFLLVGASVYSMAEGIKHMETEKEERYETVIEQMEFAAEQGEAEETLERLYEQATTLFPQYMDAYYVKAQYLHKQQGAEETVAFIEEVMSTPLVENEEMRGNLYYLYADCYFQMEKYTEAAFYYERSVAYASFNADIYRDYAITLAYLGKRTEAETLLAEAVAYGLAEADIYMVQGELARMDGKNEEAICFFGNVLEETKDEYLRQRAYVMASKAFEAIGTADALSKDTEWLSEASRTLELNNRLQILERLEQDYISLGEMTGENAYFEQAVEVMEKLVTMSWDTYLTYSNAIILCQRMGNLTKAGQWAEQMLQKYPTHYITYVRLCYLEIEQQNLKPNEERSYETFAEYYEQAKEYYKKQVSGNVTNTEMQQLEQTYQQVLEGGWLS